MTNINATLGTWTKDGYQITAKKHGARNVLVSDATGLGRIETDEQWLTRLDNMKDNGMYKV